jgi:hypothetical protein
MPRLPTAVKPDRRNPPLKTYCRGQEEILRPRPVSNKCQSGRREWDRTTDPHHVKVVLYH